jgi:hypothetical protein
VDGSIVKVRVIKSGKKGYVLESCRQGDAAWENLGPSTAATFEDKRPVKTPNTAEWSEYRAKFWDGTDVSGAWSEVVRVTVEGVIKSGEQWKRGRLGRKPSRSGDVSFPREMCAARKPSPLQGTTSWLCVESLLLRGRAPKGRSRKGAANLSA